MKHGKIFRILVIAVLLSLLPVFAPAAPALAAPIITVSPTSGAVGTVVTVTATNFESYRGDNIYIFFGDIEMTTSPIVVVATGSFSFIFNVPDAEPGEHWIRVTSEPGLTLVESLFTIPETEITLDTGVGIVGTTVTIDGKGFYADKMITFLYYNRTEGKLGTQVASPIGEFNYSFAIPGSTAGRHKIIAENAEGNSVEAEFEVVPSAVLSLISGAMGDLLTISGTGFGYRHDVAIYFGYTEIAYAKTDESGNFQVDFNVPPMMPGTYRVQVEDGDGNIDTSEFNITAGINLNQATGNVGTALLVSGTGFMVGGAVTVKYDNDVIAIATADRNGTFTAAFKVPSGKHGGHAITVSDGVNTKQLIFTMESTPPPVPTLLTPTDTGEAEAETYFDWEGVDDPSMPIAYSLQVASDMDFTLIVLEKTELGASEYTLIGEERLKSNKKEAPYYWRVQAVDGAANESDWSAPESFYVVASFALPGVIIFILIGLGAALIVFLAFWLGRRTAYHEQPYD